MTGLTNEVIHMNQIDNGANALDARGNADAALNDKLSDAMTPAYEVEFDPEQADRVGAFKEDALSEADALDSCLDATD